VPAGICSWTSGKELIPSNDFCAAAKMTNDNSTILRCYSLAETDCLKECNWYKGTGDNSNDGTNPVDPTTPVDPSTPVDPTTPVDPSTPVDPTTPVDPSTPVDPNTSDMFCNWINPITTNMPAGTDAADIQTGTTTAGTVAGNRRL